MNRPRILLLWLLLLPLGTTGDETILLVLGEERDRLVNSESQSAADWGLLAMRYQAVDQLEQAAGAYEQALMRRQSFRWHYLMAYCLDRLEMFTQAEAQYRAALKLKPSDPLTRYRLGVLLTQAGEPDAAMVLLRRANESIGDSGAVLSAMAEIEILRQRWEPARRLLRQALLRDPGAGRLAYRLAIVYRRLGRDDEAAALMVRRNNVAPAISDPHLTAVLAESMTPEAQVQVAESAWKRGQYRDALRAYENAETLAPADQGIRLARAFTLHAVERSEEALELAQAVLEEAPGNAPGWFFVADLHRLSGDHEAALEAAARSLALLDQSPTRWLLARSALALHQFERAMPHLRSLVMADEDSASYAYWLGMAMAGLTECDAARRQFRRVLNLEPNWGQAHLVSIRLDALCGDTKARVQSLRRVTALAASQENEELRISLAFAHAGVGDVEKALEVARSVSSHGDAKFLLRFLGDRKLPPTPYAPDSPQWVPE